MFLKFLQNWEENTLAGAGLKHNKKENLAHVFSSDFYEIFLEHLFIERFQVSLLLKYQFLRFSFF